VRRIIVPAEPIERLKLDVTPEMIDDVFGFKSSNSLLLDEAMSNFKLKKKNFSKTSKFV
jgi:predicted double-glycine peptidase